MRTAYEAVMFGNIEAINSPPSLKECCTGHVNLAKVYNRVVSEPAINTLCAGWR